MCYVTGKQYDNYCFILLLAGSSVLKLTAKMAIFFLKSPEEKVFS